MKLITFDRRLSDTTERLFNAAFPDNVDDDEISERGRLKKAMAPVTYPEDTVIFAASDDPETVFVLAGEDSPRPPRLTGVWAPDDYDGPYQSLKAIFSVGIPILARRAARVTAAWSAILLGVVWVAGKYFGLLSGVSWGLATFGAAATLISVSALAYWWQKMSFSAAIASYA